MAINYFIGWTQKDLEAELRAAQEDLAAGKATIQAGAGETSIQSAVDVRLTERIRMLLQALNKLDPDKFPIDQISAITQTRISFS